MSNGSHLSLTAQARCCAICDGKFGLIRYYYWRTAHCSAKCVDRSRRADTPTISGLRLIAGVQLYGSKYHRRFEGHVIHKFSCVSASLARMHSLAQTSIFAPSRRRSWQKNRAVPTRALCRRSDQCQVENADCWAHIMKFVLVNHRTPRGGRGCRECSWSVGPGYLRDVRTGTEFCDYNCYRRHHLGEIGFAYLATSPGSKAATDLVLLGMETLLAATLCWFQVGAASNSWISAPDRFGPPFATERPPSA